MSSETVTETHQAAGVTPRSPWRVKAVSPLPGWRLAVRFNDGSSGTVELEELIHGPAPGVFEPLRDAGYFAQVYIDCGAVTWPNGADLAPDAMYAAIIQSGVWVCKD